MTALPAPLPTPAEYAAMPWPQRQRLARILALGRDAEREAREQAERRRGREAKARERRQERDTIHAAEVPCDPCRQANADYQRAWMRARRVAS